MLKIGSQMAVSQLKKQIGCWTQSYQRFVTQSFGEDANCLSSITRLCELYIKMNSSNNDDGWGTFGPEFREILQFSLDEIGIDCPLFLENDKYILRSIDFIIESMKNNGWLVA